ncbi:unnamed protein product [Penicillium salamii]|uniref:SET domain-containing protein n=1 Tax=Penicillium salamii TaxID=1612424 RepID=A0A9W4JZ93_9EURO|nr:unnamed protein product [Penicillium salamii]CAG8029323.1 unnamed protein product [Penicillium salamii]CAG8064272.1 unnamed protein product [Penicillium salamii]CAG8233907.1 unnamed protein product [Penicillium salamii]CAG8309503.1 unnamed protein product [Penicillium salamii]
MATTRALGRVASLFPHIEKDWWKDAYNEMYLHTDGDCVEDSAITETECAELLEIKSVQQLFQKESIEVLDLCCGQGRHSIHLAKQYPSLSIHGIDQSVYLLDLAKERALAENVQDSIKFCEGDLRQIPAADNFFDVVILLGNSFGHCGDEGDLQSLREVCRVLKPGGIFIIDYVDGSWIRSNFNQDSTRYLHPKLKQENDYHKGRYTRVSEFVPAGTMILMETPYALVPSLDTSEPDATICSNLECNQRLFQNTERVHCQRKCIQDVAWCNDRCRAADQDRHAFECAWLGIYGERIRETEGQYDFAMLWIVLRLLAGRHIEMTTESKPREHYVRENWFTRGWKSIESLTGNAGRWPQTKIQHWNLLVEKYFGEIDRSNLTIDDVVGIISQEESNSFGLYPRATGSCPLLGPPIDRGKDYGIGVYPRTSLINHSCIPNVSWESDGKGRMILTTSRDLKAGEECSISYFDLCKYVDFNTRQSLLREYFLFSCTCERCKTEQLNGSS